MRRSPASIGKPKAVRAVARACATNPVCLVVPCHRVVPSAGGAGGYRWGSKTQGKAARDRACGAPITGSRLPGPGSRLEFLRAFNSLRHLTLAGCRPCQEAARISGVSRCHLASGRRHRRRHVGSDDRVCVRVGRLQGHPARGRSDRPWRQRPRHRPPVRRGVRVVSRARSAGRKARRARDVRRDAVGAARAGRDGQAARHPGRIRSRRSSSPRRARANPTS